MNCSYTKPYSYVEFFIPFTYGILSILLYIVLIILIVKKKKLHQPFYYYFIFLSIMNTILWIDFFILNRVNRLPFLCSSILSTFEESSSFLNITVIVFTVTSVSQLLIMMLISATRFFAVKWPTKAILPSPMKSILIILIISLFVSLTAFSWTAQFIPGPDGYPLFKANSGWPNIAPVYIISPIGAACTVFVPCSTLYAVWILMKSKKHNRNYVEMKLLITSFCFSFSSICLSVYMIGIFLGRYVLQNEEIAASFNSVKEIMLDLATLPAGWLLLLTNRDIRNFCKKKKFLSSQSTF